MVVVVVLAWCDDTAGKAAEIAATLQLVVIFEDVRVYLLQEG